MRVLIAGAGIAGLSVAHALVKRGIHPTVIARDHGATASGAGIVSAQFWDRRLAPCARRSQEIIRELVPVNTCGMAQIALSEENAALLDSIEGVDRKLPAEFESCLAQEFRKKIVRATFSRDDFWISNDNLLRNLAAGSEIITAEITGIADSSLQTTAGEFTADHLVFALGPHGSTDIEKRISMSGRFAAQLPSMLHILDTGIYVRPDGENCLVGDGDAPWSESNAHSADSKTSFLQRSAAPPVEPEFLERMNQELARVFDIAANCSAASAGILAFTADHHPIVRAHGNNWHIYGFGGDGLALAPAMGESVAHALMS